MSTRELRRTVHRRDGEQAFPAVIHHLDRLMYGNGWNVTIGGQDETVNVMATDRDDAEATLRYHYWQTPWELVDARGHLLP